MKEGLAIFTGDTIQGNVRFIPFNSNILVRGDVTSGTHPSGVHIHRGMFACHIHKYADPAIEMLGGHYDKTGNEHPNHTGDMSNIFFTRGKSMIISELKDVTLEQLYGRTIVIHKKCDDMGHVENGHAGPISSFAVIGRSVSY